MDSTKNLQDALGETETKMADFLAAELGDTIFVKKKKKCHNLAVGNSHNTNLL